ncbi:type II toxin-antitoxin system PemK/MazF family toxin [Dactylosporangium sp. CA-233914]|uniref:type II toxin-antitoxin system PemK/MazF family toxin n=1 Tax=Dactylosporangium sp. CA-233914 TaxID=3239934 RepID=UPI003D90AC80
MVVGVKRLLQAVATRLGMRRPAPSSPAPVTVARKPARGPVPGPPLKHETQKLLEYSPALDGDADPGEIVWTWVAYEDDPSQGKDRPVLVVGRKGRDVLGLMLSSQSDRDGQRNWYALGPGTWDREQRPSWVRLDRVLTVDADGIRREGAVLDRERFDRVAAQLRSGYGWA